VTVDEFSVPLLLPASHLGVPPDEEEPGVVERDHGSDDDVVGQKGLVGGEDTEERCGDQPGADDDVDDVECSQLGSPPRVSDRG